MFSAVFIMFWQLRLLDASYDYAKDYLAKDCFERKLGMNWDLKPLNKNPRRILTREILLSIENSNHR